jgi:hypothetical protein
MDRNTKRRSEVRDVRLAVHPEWSTGLRTRAWDRPWQPSQNELSSERTAYTRQQIGREDADG